MKINLPYGKNSFNSEDLIKYMKKNNMKYIIQGQKKCVRKDHPKIHSLDVWLRDNYAADPNTKQAVNEVIEALVETEIFEIKPKLKCPDSGRMCKGIKIRKV